MDRIGEKAAAFGRRFFIQRSNLRNIDFLLFLGIVCFGNELIIS